ncbi:unnamed protein product [Spirodela intermedia]|uniref:Uncharacterized protein n=1 Tax=Spirodela intermedia TaxID=51605 RepID=A0A7I8LHD5_SPIIN|nr:unnamed protein product [Spirodela intermedia]
MSGGCCWLPATRPLIGAHIPPPPPSVSGGFVNLPARWARPGNIRTGVTWPIPNGRTQNVRPLRGMMLPPVDPWAPTMNSQSVASQLFAASLFPYLGFLYFITKSNSAPKLTLFGFYFLLAFVGATIPAGIYAKVHYGTSLSNVDWLHGGAESLLTLTNLFIVLGLREGLRKIKSAEEIKDDLLTDVEQEEQPSL